MTTQDFYLKVTVRHEDNAPEERIADHVLGILNKAIDSHLPDWIEDADGSEHWIDLDSILSEKHVTEDMAALKTRIKTLESQVDALQSQKSYPAMALELQPAYV